MGEREENAIPVSDCCSSSLSSSSPEFQIESAEEMESSSALPCQTM